MKPTLWSGPRLPTNNEKRVLSAFTYSESVKKPRNIVNMSELIFKVHSVLELEICIIGKASPYVETEITATSPNSHTPINPHSLSVNPRTLITR
jgi:hypothetical protein